MTIKSPTARAAALTGLPTLPGQPGYPRAIGLLCLALLLAPSGAPAECGVSSNVVGYVQVGVPGGLYSLIANPLNYANNTVGAILPVAGDGDMVLSWDYTAQDFVGPQATYSTDIGAWSDPSVVLKPGDGFIYVNSTASRTLTLVGTVPEGSNLTNPNLHNANVSVMSSIVPQARSLGTSGAAGTLQFPAVGDDTALMWDVLQSAWSGSFYTFLSPPGAWDPYDPVIGVGQGFGVSRSSPGGPWTRNFVVSCPGGPGLAIALRTSDGKVTITWTANANWTLQSADDPEGPWTSLSGVVSPYTFAPTSQKKFFRLNCQSDSVIITCPANQVVACTSPTGAIATFTATATNLCGQSYPVTCTPPSGSVFPVGTTTVDCVAAVTNHCSFTVTVMDECGLSANVVGYVQVSVPGNNAMSLLGNPLDASLGGTVAGGNSVGALLPIAGNNDKILTWDRSAYNFSSFTNTYSGGAWLDPSQLLNPGRGFWYQNNSTDSRTLTFVGSVLEGHPAGIYTEFSAGYQSVVSSMVPEPLPVGPNGGAGTLQFPAQDGDIIKFWDSAVNEWSGFQPEYSTDAGCWAPSDPVIGVAQGFAVVTSEAHPAWAQNFAVSSTCGPLLGIHQTNGQVTVTWTAPRPWALMVSDGIPRGVGVVWPYQTSPYTFLPDSPKKFFRLVSVALWAEQTSTNTLFLSWRNPGYQLQKRPSSVPTWSDVTNTPAIVGGEYQVCLDEFVGWARQECVLPYIVATCSTNCGGSANCVSNIFYGEGACTNAFPCAPCVPCLVNTNGYFTNWLACSTNWFSTNVVSLTCINGGVTNIFSGTNVDLHCTKAFVTNRLGWVLTTSSLVPAPGCNWQFHPTNEATFFRLRQQ